MSTGYKSKRKKDYPCIRCDEHVKKNEKAIQCALCELWVHKTCEKMSVDLFKVLDMQNEETGQCFWSCRSCQSYALKFDKRMRNIEKRMQALEDEKIPTIEKDLGTAKQDIEELKETTKKLATSNKELVSAGHANVTASVLEEMKERESRRNNLIVHNLPEPGPDITDSKERITKDIEKVQELLNMIDVDIVAAECSRFAKRLGKRDDENESPPPLLIGFKTTDNCMSILDKSPNLSEIAEPWSMINIVRDLTKTQRKEESKMREEAETKNSQLTDEEKENWQWTVVGRRGERKIVKTSVNQEEEELPPSGRGEARRRGRPNRRRNNLRR